MHSYMTVFYTERLDRFAPLIGLVESLLGRRIAAGITLRNVAAMPRTGQLAICADAPTPDAVSRLFTACGLVPIRITAAHNATWGGLIERPRLAVAVRET